MIYSKDDVARMLNTIREEVRGHKKCRPHDCDAVLVKIGEIQQQATGEKFCSGCGAGAGASWSCPECKS